MGADLLIECIVIESGSTAEELRAKVLKQIEGITLETHKDMIKGFYSEVLGVDGIFENDPIMTIEDIRQDFTEYVNDAMNRIEKQHRDIATIEHKGDTLYLTGGMSCGDSPTDSFDAFRQFNDLHYLFESNDS